MTYRINLIIFKKKEAIMSFIKEKKCTSINRYYFNTCFIKACKLLGEKDKPSQYSNSSLFLSCKKT